MSETLSVISLDQAKVIGQVLGSSAGSKALKTLQKTFATNLSYTQGDTHHTAYKEGQRSVIHFLENAIKYAKAEDK
jgi:hypothetical protein